MKILRGSYYAILISATLLAVGAIASAPTVERASQTAGLVAVSD